MVGYNIDGPRRDAVLKLMDEKDKIESELREHNAILHANNVGMDDPLVDAQGYPRNDIDVYKVRHARHRIICLKNDIKEIMKRIERGLWEVYDPNASHSQSATNGVQSAPAAYTNGFGRHPDNGAVDRDDQGLAEVAFAEVGVVQMGSPADMAGLTEYDQLLQFGSINHENYTEFLQIRDVVMHSVGQPIQVRVKRGHSVINISLVPRPWAQPGLLGCEIRRISQV